MAEIKVTGGEAGLQLQRKPWKVWMSTTPEPSISLTTLYDLLFFSSGVNAGITTYVPLENKAPEVGKDLGHNILIYNTNLYELSTGLIKANAEVDLYKHDKIDICYARYAKESRPTQIKFNDGTLKGLTFNIPDKNAILAPVTAEEVYKGISQGASTAFRNENPSTIAMVTEFTVAPYNGSNRTTVGVVMISPDTVFDASLVTESYKKSFTQVCLNPFMIEENGSRAATVWQLINFCINQLDTSGSLSPRYAETSVEANVTKILEDLNSSTDKEKYLTLFKHCFVWVQAPFAADYIDPKDFNQNLNQDSEVIHKNIYSAVDGHNFARYDEYTSDSVLPEKSTRGYFSTNAPLVDFVSNKLHSTYEQDDVKKILEAYDKDPDNSKIGGPLTLPKSGLKEKNPITYFDPELYETYQSLKGDKPALLPKEGNIYTDGRILSPTVDELWYIIKKLIVGRPADSISKDTEDFGRVKGSDAHENEIDTQIGEVKNFNFITSDTSTVIGDPIKIDNGDEISVVEYVTNVDIVDYADFKEIATYRTELYETGHETTIPEYFKLNTKEDENEKWKPRKSALSLRELEARTLVNKYNILNAYKDIITNFALTGQHGFVNEVEAQDTTVTLAAGSLYMLHREYDPTFPKKTVFKMNGEGTEENYGLDVTFGDLADDNKHQDESTLHLYNSENIKDSKKPLLVKNYGLSTSLYPEDGKYTGADVYMAADGTWRYKQEHVRLPILRSIF